jgi:steroid 5-alpha reductase family enzyme
VKLDLVLFAAATVVCLAVFVATGQPPLGGLAVAVAAFAALWVVSLVLRNASIVDVAWGPGFLVLGLFYLLTEADGPTPRGLLVVALTAVWALRLALHIAIRNAGAGEDFRYRSWREQAGASFWWVSFFKVFLLQAVLLWIVSSPLALAQPGGPGSALTAVDALGLALFLFGFLFEAVADWQLARFKGDPANRGRVMRSGLWSRSRHPNYFGESVLWWGIGLLAVPSGGPLALLGPLMITFLLLRISGVALLDAALVERRPGYAEYMDSTPAFFPRLSRHRG